MHRVAKAKGKLSKRQFEELYDPLDLYSGEEGRMEKAVNALWKDWKESEGKTNNFRLFWNGQLVRTEDAKTLGDIASFLYSNSGEEGGVEEALTKCLVEELSKTTLPSAQGQGKVSVLNKLAYLQSALDPCDVEGLASFWLQHTQSHTLGQLPPASTAASTASLPAGLTSSLPSPTLAPLLEKFLSTPPSTLDSPSVEPESLEAAIQAFLVSATFKDCSVLIRFTTPTNDDGEGTKPVEGETKLVDLDRKLSPSWLVCRKRITRYAPPSWIG